MKKFLIFILILGIAGLALWQFKMRAPQNPTNDIPKEVTTSPLYGKSPKDLGLEAEEWSGYMKLLPDGDHIIAGGVSRTGGFKNFMYLLSLKDGTGKLITGNPLEGAFGKNIISTAWSDGLHTFNLGTGEEKIYAITESIHTASISPGENKIVINTDGGIRVLDLPTGLISKLSYGKQDGAFAWFSDNNRVFGFHQTNENLYEAGRGRVLTIWDITKKTHTDVTVDFPSSALRYIEWIVPDKIARVNAGFDDGSFDYSIDLDRNFVRDFGETSGMLMGGIVVDRDLEALGLLGLTYHDNGTTDNVVKIDNTNGDALKSHKFADTETRQVLKIIDLDNVIYVKSKYIEAAKIWHSEIIKFSYKDNREVVLAKYDQNFNSLVLTPDKNTLIVPTKGRLVAIDLR